MAGNCSANIHISLFLPRRSRTSLLNQHFKKKSSRVFFSFFLNSHQGEKDSVTLFRLLWNPTLKESQSIFALRLGHLSHPRPPASCCAVFWRKKKKANVPQLAWRMWKKTKTCFKVFENMSLFKCSAFGRRELRNEQGLLEWIPFWNLPSRFTSCWGGGKRNKPTQDAALQCCDWSWFALKCHACVQLLSANGVKQMQSLLGFCSAKELKG